MILLASKLDQFGLLFSRLFMTFCYFVIIFFCLVFLCLVVSCWWHSEIWGQAEKHRLDSLYPSSTHSRALSVKHCSLSELFGCQLSCPFYQAVSLTLLLSHSLLTPVFCTLLPCQPIVLNHKWIWSVIKSLHQPIMLSFATPV